MVRLWGNIPVVTKVAPNITSENFDEVYPLYFPLQTPEIDTYKQIESDLLFAVQNAPDYNPADKRVMTKTVARALLAKLYAEKPLRDYDRITSYNVCYTKLLRYKDSLFHVVDHSTDLYLSMKETAYRDNSEFAEALQVNDMRLSKVKSGTPEYALITFHRALAFQQNGDRNQEKKFLALSALSDIQSAIKDHASLWMLAQLLYEDGDVERAYHYIRFSWDETNFYRNNFV